MNWYFILIIIISSVSVLLFLTIVFYKPFFKRIWDIFLSILAIVVLSPIFVLLYVLGMVFLKGNPLFFQKRPGKNEKIFDLVKFRSMSSKKDKSGHFLPDEERLSKYGLFIRKTSLDELPELINILIGDMSFVGPRPLLPEYLPRYNDHQKKRHDVRPGLTGYAQVHGRNLLSWEEKFELDVWYTQNYSFWIDIKIFFSTFLVVLKKNGINSNTSITMEEFKGEKNEKSSK